MAKDSDPFYKQPIFWILMSGPFIVIIAAFFTFGLAHTNAADLVTDDYYKDGKHINLQIERDEEAVKRNIRAQVLINPEGTAAKVFVSGDFDRNMPLNLLLLHPVKKALDQTVVLKPLTTQSGDKTEYTAVFQTLPKTVHWYVRVEDANGVWRVEEKWLPSQGVAIDLSPNVNAVKALSRESASAAK